jgi:hypothetical protein
MEFEPKHSPAPVRDPDLSRLQKQAIDALRQAITAIERYQTAQRRQGFRQPGGVGGFEPDPVHSVVEEEVLPLFLGAPGEVCDSCGGSGRKT